MFPQPAIFSKGVIMFGIIGAMEDEIALLRALMTGIQVEQMAGFKFIRGTLDGKDTVLLRCGIGKVSAGIGCALLIREYNPDLVINTGSAGGLGSNNGPKLTFGDVVISSGLVYHDFDLTVFGYAPGQLPGMNVVFDVDKRLVRLACRAVSDLKKEGALPENMQHVTALVGSGDVFKSDDAVIEGKRLKFPGMRAVDMEGAAIAHACSLFNVPCLVIRALSDVAGAESPVKFDEFLPVAAKHSSEIVRRLLQYL
jgi:adenosylhomocysteine nucleosidase